MLDLNNIKPLSSDTSFQVDEFNTGIIYISDSNSGNIKELQNVFKLSNPEKPITIINSNQNIDSVKDDTGEINSFILDLSSIIQGIKMNNDDSNYSPNAISLCIEYIKKFSLIKDWILVYKFGQENDEKCAIKDIVLKLLFEFNNIKLPFQTILVQKSNNQPFICIYTKKMSINTRYLLNWFLSNRLLINTIHQTLTSMNQGNINLQQKEIIDKNKIFSDKEIIELSKLKSPDLQIPNPKRNNNLLPEYEINPKEVEIQQIERQEVISNLPPLVVPEIPDQLNISNFDFLTSKSKLSRVIYDEDANLSEKDIDDVTNKKMSIDNLFNNPKEIVTGIFNKLKDILGNNIDKAKKASDALKANNIQQMSIYVNEAIEEADSNIYPEKPEVQQEVLDKLDEWSESRGRVKPHGIDPILTNTFIDKNVKSNLHRVMAQKEITWKEMPFQIEEMITPVLSDNGFKILGVTIVDNPPNIRDIEPTYMSDIKIRLQNLKTKKIQTLKFIIPTLIDGKYHIQGGVKYLFPNVIATLPIFVVTPGKVQFKTNYSAITFLHKIVQKKDLITVRANGVNMSFLTWLLQLQSFEEICKIFGLEYKVLNNKKETTEEDKLLIKLGGGRLLSFKITANSDNEKRLAQAIINDLQPLINKLGNVTETYNKDADKKGDIITALTGRKNVEYNFGKMKRYMIDVRNAQILRQRNINPTLIDVSKVCGKISVNDIQEGKLDISNTYLRLMDMIPGEIERAFHYALTEYRRRSVMDPNVELVVNPGWVINQLREQAVLMMYKDGNPTIEAAQFTALRIVGPGGFSKVDSVQIKDRAIPPSHFGVIDPIDTAEGDPGIQTYLTSGFEYDPDRKVFTQPKKLNSYTNMFSSSASMIPFIQHDSGNRAQFGCSQTRQVVPVVGGTAPLVCTGMEGYIPSYASEKFIKKSKQNGVVTYVDENCIILKYNDGTTEAIDIKPQALMGGSGHASTLTNTPIVKVGDKVNAFQQLTSNQFINKNGIYSSGFNVLAAFKTQEGYSYEDGIVVSESFAKKTTSVHFEELELTVDSLSELKIFPIQRLKETGNMKYEPGEVIVKVSVAALGGLQEKCEVAKYPCEVTDIKIYPAKPEFIPLVKETDMLLNGKTNKALLANGLKPKTDIQGIIDNIGKFQIKKEIMNRTVIKIYLTQYVILTNGSKLNNRHGNKGVVTRILPDDKMPVTPEGERIDVCLNPLGVVGRANLGQLYEMHVGSVLEATRKKIVKMNDQQAKELLIKIYQLLDGSPNKQLSTDMINNLNAMNPQQLKIALDELRQNGVRVIIRAYDSITMKDIDEAAKLVDAHLKAKLYLPEYDRYTVNECMYGPIFMNKLEHISEFKINSRSIGRYVSTNGLPAKAGAGRNAIRIGEQDTYCILGGYDAKNLLDELFIVNGNNVEAKNKVINDIIENGSAELKESDLLQFRASGSNHVYNVLMNSIGLTIN